MPLVPAPCQGGSTLHTVGARDRWGVGYGSRHMDRMAFWKPVSMLQGRPLGSRTLVSSQLLNLASIMTTPCAHLDELDECSKAQGTFSDSSPLPLHIISILASLSSSFFLGKNVFFSVRFK